MKGNQAAVCLLRKFKFFRVLLPGFSRRLSLPRAFTKYCIQENGTQATLLSPLGKSWHVRVCRDGGAESTLNFEDGWKKFVEDHKLAMGDFLVFKHRGSFVFDVTIFDQTTCERQYHHSTTTTTTTGVGSTSRSGATTIDKIPAEQDQEAPKEEELISTNISAEASKGTTSFSCGKRAAEPMESSVITSSVKRRSIDVEEYLKEQSGHDPKEPAADVTKEAPGGPQFQTVIRHFHKQPYVEIPAAFAASTKLSSSSVSRRVLFLKDPKGVVWPTNLSHCRSRGAGSRLRARIYRGWRRFCVANDLEEGDTCVFELRESNMLHVQVRKRVMSLQTYRRKEHRRKEVRPMKAPQDVSMGKKKPLCEVIEPPTRCPPKQVPAAVQDDHTPLPPYGRFFTSKISPTGAARGYLRIPRRFLVSLATFSTVRQVVLVDGQSREWPAKVCHWKESSIEHACISAGWRAFCRCNHVVAGDLCLFRVLIVSRKRDFVFHVEVVKAR